MVKTKYQSFNKKPGFRPGVKTLLLLLVVVLVLIPPVRSVFTGLLQRLAAPLWSVSNKLDDSVGGPLSYFASKKKLEAEVEDLKTKLWTYRSTESQNKLLIRENQVLNEALGLSTGSYGFYRAPVLRHDGGLKLNNWLIDISGLRGLSDADLVYAPGGLLLGRIALKSGPVAQVELFSSMEELNIVLGGEERILVSASGLGHLAYSASVPKEVDVSVGDVVSYPNSYPSVLGEVVLIESIDQSVFKELTISAQLVPSEIVDTFVLVLKDSETGQ